MIRPHKLKVCGRVAKVILERNAHSALLSCAKMCVVVIQSPKQTRATAILDYGESARKV